MRYIYIAGPISRGDTVLNIRAALDAADAVLSLGLIPFVPHLSAFWHLVSAKEYEDWVEYDAAWLARCDAILRLPGPSYGADREVQWARVLGLPVFFGINQLEDAVLVLE